MTDLPTRLVGLAEWECRLLHDPALVAQADPDDLTRLLTTIVRGDRFSEGEIAGAYKAGMLTAIARRAGVLLASASRDAAG